jgi:hypothetical protein
MLHGVLQLQGHRLCLLWVDHNKVVCRTAACMWQCWQVAGSGLQATGGHNSMRAPATQSRTALLHTCCASIVDAIKDELRRQTEALPLV